MAGLLTAFIYRRSSRLSQGIANSSRVTLMVRPIFWQNPVRVTRPVPPGRCSVAFNPLCFMTGRSLGRFALVRSSVFRLLPVLGLSPVLRPLQTVSVFPGLATVPNFIHLHRPYGCFRLFDHLRQLSRARSLDQFRLPCRSAPFAIPTFRLAGFPDRKSTRLNSSHRT